MEFFRNSVVAIEFKSSRIAAFKMLSNGSQTLRSRFHPLVQKWFESKFKQPTEIQEKAWELIAAGEHSLISAATGSGKTLAAFLWAIDQLASGKWELGQTRVPYISPLKALNNDIRRNLLEPLTELKDSFEREGLAWPNIRVMTRSGDTAQGDRRKMLRNPPEILITTPESLNLMLTSVDGQRALLGVKSLILDEIHAVVGGKRGVYLMTAVERLAYLNGEFQRIALSATVHPMNTVAAFVGGSIAEGGRFLPRLVKQANVAQKKVYAIDVRFPEEVNEDLPDDDFWHPIVQELKEIVASNNSTLIFVNSRQLCEKITYKINRDESVPIAYSHHGSLSKEIRFAVEQRLKNGELKAIVATNSLEMGIDVGSLDRVVMVQCPGVISSAVQKVGRAGHQVGAVSQATVFPSHSRDFLEAAVLSKAIKERDIEAVRPIESPLDVLAQIVVSMAGSKNWDIDELFLIIKSSYSFRNLQREPFDLVLNMLAGRYESSRLRELKPRVSINRIENTITIRKGAILVYYFSGGVIPDRGYFHLRLEGPGSRIGELDEEFVWERSIGDTFTLGAQSWRIERITYNDVFVTPGSGTGPMPPFWRSEEFNRDFHYSSRIGEFLSWADEQVERKEFQQVLESDFAFNPTTAKALTEHLRNQKAATRRPLPHRHHILAEFVDTAPAGAPGQQLILHTHWGGKVNRPYALALDMAWDEHFGHRAEVYVNNDCVVVTVSEEVNIDEALRLVTSSNVESLLRKRLEDSGFFGARFREAAGTALLITRHKAGQRLPLWLSRMRSKKLLDSVRRYEDFPMMLEAWRTCLKDEFDMESLKQVLAELESGITEITTTRVPVASPFARSVAWRQINDVYMYDSDDPRGGERSNLREDLISSVAFDDALRPTVSEAITSEFESKRKRLAPGYAPSDEIELKEWLRDRITIPGDEWNQLLEQIEWIPKIADRGPGWSPPFEIQRRGGCVYLQEESKRVDSLFSLEPDPDLFTEWLSYYGLVSVNQLRDTFPAEDENLDTLISALVDERRLVAGRLKKGSDEVFVCECENFEILLRMQRANNRPIFDSLPLSALGPFLAERQGVLGLAKNDYSVVEILEQLALYGERVGSWEEDILPARFPQYRTATLDGCLVEEGVEWFGTGDKWIAFRFLDEREYWESAFDGPISSEEKHVLGILSDASGGRFDFHVLQERARLNASRLEESLWSLAWKGKVGNDSYASIRRGALANFSIAGATKSQNSRREKLASGRARTGRRTRMLATSNTIAYPGNWFAFEETDLEVDEVSLLERHKERSRILLDRYGILFRELLARELPGMQWKDVFKALRLMELSGEILAGAFFDDIPGLQFASHDALRRLRQQPGKKAIYWLSAIDPASLCGLGLEALKGKLPKRLASTRLAYRGEELLLEVLRSGKAVIFHIPPEDPDVERALEPIRHMLTRSFNPIRTIHLETINDEDARVSPYLEVLGARFRLHCDHKRVVIEGVR